MIFHFFLLISIACFYKSYAEDSLFGDGEIQKWEDYKVKIN